jgi:hypothetical protein
MVVARFEIFLRLMVVAGFVNNVKAKGRRRVCK